MPLKEDLKTLLKEDDVLLGTVLSVSGDGWICDVQPEDPDAAVISDVPLRIQSTPDDMGIIVEPVEGSTVEVRFIDGRPVLGKVQQWERIIVQGQQKVELTKDGKVVINDGTHPAVRGDVAQSWANEHGHPYTWTDPGGSGVSDPPEPPFPDDALNQKVLID